MQAFRFQTGSIKSGDNLELIQQLPCFDSKLVRLKVLVLDPIGIQYISFDSKLVRLKVKKALQKLSAVASFDSKLVRLKVTAVEVAQTIEASFRFQTGSIKS